MTKFEQVGVNLQLDAESAYDATRKMTYSCKVCCSRGMRICCDRCAISSTHQQMLGVFRDVAEAGERMKAKERERVSIETEVVKVSFHE